VNDFEYNVNIIRGIKQDKACAARIINLLLYGKTNFINNLAIHLIQAYVSQQKAYHSSVEMGK